MKYLLVIAFSALATLPVYAQNFRCSWDGIAVKPTAVEAQTAVERELEDMVDDVVEELLEEIGLSNFNYDTYGSNNIRNCQAEFDKAYKTFDIYYSFTFLKNLRSRLGDDDEFVIGVAVILLHELGHHLNGHVHGRGGDPDEELESDYFAGKWAARHEIPYDSAIKVYRMCTSVGETNTHPGRADRIDSFREGYLSGQ